MSAGLDPDLLTTAQEFADEVAHLLDGTIADDPSVKAQVVSDRVLVAAIDDDGDTATLPLNIAGRRQLDLRVSFRCTFDFTGSFLAIEESEFALILPAVRQPVVRFDYVRRRAASP
jgi:hypothetical protein